MDTHSTERAAWERMIDDKTADMHTAWADFDKFLADMGTCPPGAQLDCIDKRRGYEPGNCRWATPTEARGVRPPRRR